MILPSTTKAGYTFDGWYLSSTGSDRVGGSGDPYKPSTSLVLYAHWTQKVQYVITFNSSGGTSCESKVVDSGTTIELPSPTKTNCTFLGWYTSATGGTEVTSPYKVVENITLYAHWSTWVVEIAGPYDEYLFFLKFYLNGELQSNITGNVNWYLDGELVHNGSELRYKLTTTPSVGEHTIKVIATITNSTFGSIEDELAFVATEYGPEPLDPVDPEDDHNTYIMIAAGIIVGIVAIIMIARII